MARIPYSKLKNLRSGNTVWRVLIWFNRKEEMKVSCTQTPIVGKKVLHVFSKSYKSFKMVWKRFEKTDPFLRNSKMYSVAVFLNDLKGTACFDTKRSADRFVEELKAGLHPDIADRAYEKHYWNEMTDRLESDQNIYDLPEIDFDLDGAFVEGAVVEEAVEDEDGSPFIIQ